MKILKSIVLTLSVICFAGCTYFTKEPEIKNLKVLSIGNSFSTSVMSNLNKIVEKDPNATLNLTVAARGGCSFRQHWECYLKSQKDPDYKPYSKKYNLQEMLTMQKWDIVVIQQASHFSWDPKTYYPYADHLIDLIKKLAPQAEIVIQQTWSYNNADRRIQLSNKNGWHFDQNGMYERLTDAYTQLAKKYDLRMIPSGYAVQLYRQSLGKNLAQINPGDYKKPELPANNDVVGTFYWGKNPKNGKDLLRTDCIHLNSRGTYLQACVWYAFLYQKDPEKISYISKKMDPKDAADLREIAKKAVAEFPQVKK